MVEKFMETLMWNRIRNMKAKSPKRLGEFTLVNTLTVTDPCYTEGFTSQHSIVKLWDASKGVWVAFMDEDDFERFGEPVKERTYLIAVHQSVASEITSIEFSQEFTNSPPLYASVDAGQLSFLDSSLEGVFDTEEKWERWWKKVTNGTCGKKGYTVLPHGVAVKTEGGDGGFPVFAGKGPYSRLAYAVSVNR